MDETDHDLLIRIDERLRRIEEGWLPGIEKKIDNHLSHHTLYTLGAWGAALAAIGALVVAMITR